MKKIMIIGSGGAGKSTLARQLGQIMSLDVYHLDKIFWKPNWTSIGHDEFSAVQRSITTGDSWIIDGNYSSTMDIRLKDADTVIYLDYPTRVCLYRAVKRFMLNRGRTRVDMAKGCPEKIDKDFIKWIWNFRKRNRSALLLTLKDLDKEKNIIILSKPSMTRQLLNCVKRIKK